MEKRRRLMDMAPQMVRDVSSFDWDDLLPPGVPPELSHIHC